MLLNFLYYMALFNSVEGEHIEMGGIIDAEKGALLYRRTTNVKTVETDGDDMFQKKKIIQVTDETGWLGEDETTINQKEIEKHVKEPEKDAGLIEQGNPLYSDQEYDVGFNNPMYLSKSGSSTDKKVTDRLQQQPQEQVEDDAAPAEGSTITSKLLTPSQRRGRKEAATEGDNQYYLASEPTADPEEDTVDTYF